MLRVLKYPYVNPEGDGVPVFIEFQMPKDAEIVAFQVQREIPCMWAVGDADKGLEARSFQLLGTGHEAPEGKYIGTVLMDGGDLVLHAFETTT